MAPREPRPWGQALLGGLMLALGGAVFGAGRRAPASGKPAAGRPSAGRPSSGRVAGKGKGAAKPVGRSVGKSVGKPSPERRPGAERPRVRTKPKAVAAAVRTRHWPPPPPKPIATPERDPDAAVSPVDAASVKLGYERVDVKPGTIVTVMLASASVLAVSIAILFFLIGQVHRNDRQAAPLTPQQLAVILPPGPRLQDHPLHDIAMELKRETDRLASYAWADPQHRTARIPIDRAEALVIGRPLDPLPAAAPPAAGTAAPAPAGQP